MQFIQHIGILGAALALIPVPTAATLSPSNDIGHYASMHDVEAAEPPEWSNYGPAEREFDVGFVMFAEHRDGKWHAWVPSYWGSWTPLAKTTGGRDTDLDPQSGQVLEFFSGKVVEAILHQDEMGHALPEFTDLEGVFHAPDKTEGRSAIRSKELVRNRQIGDLMFASYWQFDPSEYEGCDTTLTAVEKSDAHDGHLLWSRLILNYSPPTERCPHGHWQSQARAALDLHDGTFLVALDSKVVRLSFADLSPVGTGAKVKIVEVDLVLDIIAGGGDIHEQLNKALSNHE